MTKNYNIAQIDDPFLLRDILDKRYCFVTIIFQIIDYRKSSGDGSDETSGDGSDDSEIDRDESSDEDSYDRDDSESSDYGTGELSRLTRDRYRRRVEDDLAVLNGNLNLDISPLISTRVANGNLP